MRLPQPQSPAVQVARPLLAFFALVGCGEVDVVGVLGSDPGSGGVDAGARDAGVSLLTECAQATRVFGQAICACDGLTSADALVTDVPAEAPPRAHVRVVGSLQATALSGPIAGDVQLAGGGVSLLAGEAAVIEGDLRADGELGIRGMVTIAGDAYLQTPLLGDGSLGVAGDLHGPTPAVSDPARLTVAGELLAPTAPAPAPCVCDGSAVLGIAAWAAAVEHDNDNDAAGFDADAFVDALADTAADAPPSEWPVLPGGTLYLSSLKTRDDLRVRVTERTALWFKGKLDVGGDVLADIAPGGELAIFVGGDAKIRGALQLGSADAQGGADVGRLYVAGGVSLPSEAPAMTGAMSGAMGGATEPWVVHLYAPQLQLSLSAAARVVGSLYAGSIVSFGPFALLHDPAIELHPEVCDVP